MKSDLLVLSLPDHINVQQSGDSTLELKIRTWVWLAKIKFDWQSVQFDTNMIKFWVAIVENCTENGH